MKMQLLMTLICMMIGLNSWAVRNERFDLSSKGQSKEYNVELNRSPNGSYEVKVYKIGKGTSELIYESDTVKKTPGGSADVYKDGRFQLLVNNGSYVFTLNNGQFIRGELE